MADPLHRFRVRQPEGAVAVTQPGPALGHAADGVPDFRTARQAGVLAEQGQNLDGELAPGPKAADQGDAHTPDGDDAEHRPQTPHQPAKQHQTAAQHRHDEGGLGLRAQQGQGADRQGGQSQATILHVGLRRQQGGGADQADRHDHAQLVLLVPDAPPHAGVGLMVDAEPRKDEDGDQTADPQGQEGRGQQSGQGDPAKDRAQIDGEDPGQSQGEHAPLGHIRGLGPQAGRQRHDDHQQQGDESRPGRRHPACAKSDQTQDHQIDRRPDQPQHRRFLLLRREDRTQKGAGQQGQDQTGRRLLPQGGGVGIAS
ncbi:hypothetical protein D3C73_996190 [compost metagenome]